MNQLLFDKLVFTLMYDALNIKANNHIMNREEFFKQYTKKINEILDFLKIKFINDKIGMDDFEEFKAEVSLKFVNYNLEKFENAKNKDGYIYATINNLLMDFLRKRNRIPVKDYKDENEKIRKDPLYKKFAGKMGYDIDDEIAIKKGSTQPDARKKYDTSDSYENAVSRDSLSNPENYSDPLVLQAFKAVSGNYHKENEVDELSGYSEEWNEVCSILEEGLNKLDSSLKKTIGKMYFCQCMTVTSISKAINRSQGTVSEHITYIKNCMLDFFDKKYPELGISEKKYEKNYN